MQAPAILRCAAACLLVLLPAAASAKRPHAPPLGDTITSRMVVEKQLAPQPGRPAGLSGAEARRVHDRYLDSIGKPIQPSRDEQGRSGQ